MERRCPRILAPPFAFGWGASSATKTPNIFRGSSSPTTWTFTAKATGPGTAAFDCHPAGPPAPGPGADRAPAGGKRPELARRHVTRQRRETAIGAAVDPAGFGMFQ